MKAVTYQGVKSVGVAEVADPKIEKPDDIIVRITSTAICGSDLHIYRGSIPTREGFVIGHEPNSNDNPHLDTGAYFGYTERYGDCAIC